MTDRIKIVKQWEAKRIGPELKGSLWSVCLLIASGRERDTVFRCGPMVESQVEITMNWIKRILGEREYELITIAEEDSDNT